VEDLTSRLDLRPLTGRYEAGSVLEAQVRGHDKTFGLTRLAFAGGQLMVPHVALPLGTPLRVRVRARDVALALAPPEGTSIQNIFPARVKDLARDQGPLVDVLLDAGGAPLWARAPARRSRSNRADRSTPSSRRSPSIATASAATARLESRKSASPPKPLPPRPATPRLAAPATRFDPPCGATAPA
jgi:hypothetical protein